jgi:hypothetical protein
MVGICMLDLLYIYIYINMWVLKHMRMFGICPGSWMGLGSSGRLVGTNPTYPGAYISVRGGELRLKNLLGGTVYGPSI